MTTRTRAPRLSLDERRRRIKEATLPLLAEYGIQISTKQIASAANIAEGTIFKAFDSKEELINETLADAFSPDRIIGQLAAIDESQPLAAVLRDLAALLNQEITEKRALIAMVPHPKERSGDPAKCPVQHRADARDQLVTAVEAKLESFADQLRVPTPRAAAALLGLTFAACHPMTATGALTPETVADLVQHGAVKS